jgi:hypothetical protein
MLSKLLNFENVLIKVEERYGGNNLLIFSVKHIFYDDLQKKLLA